MKTTKNLVKRVSALAVIAIFGMSSLFAQKSGVFKSYVDYKINKMIYSIDCAKEKHEIKLNDFWGKDFITVVHEGKSYNLKKADIWGFELCDAKIVRFQGKEDYELADKSVLWIYSKQTVVSAGVKTGGSKKVTTYYFSKGGDGEIKALTLLNIKAAYPDNHMLHDAIDGKFDSDASLGVYDEFHKHYKINHFLEMQKVK
ncbi:MAG: hypothetical protein ACYC25_10310 [Paludibacter sp.]